MLQGSSTIMLTAHSAVYDVIFDMNVNFHSVNDTDLPSEQEFNNIPTLELVADADNADALRRQLILAPALPISLSGSGVSGMNGSGMGTSISGGGSGSGVSVVGAIGSACHSDRYITVLLYEPTSCSSQVSTPVLDACIFHYTTPRTHRR